MEDELFAEALIDAIHQQLVTDEECYTKKVRHLLSSYYSNPEIIDDFMISLCGWSMTTLIDMAKNNIVNKQTIENQ